MHLDPCVLMHTNAQGARVKTDLNDPLGFLREMVKNRFLGLEGSQWLRVLVLGDDSDSIPRTYMMS